MKEQYCLKQVGFHLNTVVPDKKPCLKPNPVIKKNVPDNLVQLSIVDGIQVALQLRIAYLQLRSTVVCRLAKLKEWCLRRELTYRK